MNELWSRLQADPLAADLIDWGRRWWWVGLVCVLVVALLPRRS